MAMKTLSKNSHGFTLIEIIVTLLLVGILAAAASFGIVGVARGFAAAKENARMAQTAQVALLRMTRELMTLESIDAASASGITLTKTNASQVAIELVDTQILLDDDDDAADGEVLIDKVDSLTLVYTKYDDSSWTQGSDDIETLARIDIELALSRDDLDDPITFTTSINPRNNGTQNAPYRPAT